MAKQRPLSEGQQYQNISSMLFLPDYQALKEAKRKQNNLSEKK